MKLYISWETVPEPFDTFRMGHLEKKWPQLK